MSGTSCGSGCTDCPTCRGEVQPDAPAMHDLAFAMSIGRGPQSADRFLGTLSIAQTLREGIRRRGGTARGDAEVLRFVDGLTKELVVALGAPPQWDGQVGSHVLSVMPSRAAAAIAPPTTPTPGRRETPPEGERFGPGSKPEENEYFFKNCCVKKFEYPECYSKAQDPTPLDKNSLARLGVLFKVHAQYVHDPERLCYCECCEFRQFASGEQEFEGFDAKKGKLTLVDLDDGDTLPEDCLVMINGEPVGPISMVINFLRDQKKRAPTTAEVKEAVAGLGGTIWCYGRREDPAKSETYSDPSDPADLKTACDYRMKDRVTVTLAPAALRKRKDWHSNLRFVGMIIDKCNGDAVRAWKEFTVRAGGTVGPDGNEQWAVTVTETLDKGASKERTPDEDCK